MCLMAAGLMLATPGNAQDLGATNDLPADDNWFGGIGPAAELLTSPQWGPGTVNGGEAKTFTGCVNDYCPSHTGYDPGEINPFLIESSTTGETQLGWCSESGIVSVADPLPYNEVSVDGRLQYLLWRYDYDYYLNGNMSAAKGAALQALVWAWRSDPETGSTVFAGQDPLNWNNLAVDTYVSGEAGLTAGRVGFTGETVENGETGSLWMEDEDLLAANQATYDFAVEATAKAGPWTLDDSDPAGVTLTGANGAISGESVTFDVGDAATTDANGFAAWPEGATTASVEAPGNAYETQPTGSQNILMSVFGTTLNGDRAAEPTTTTTTTTVAPTTTTIVIAPPSTTVAPTTTTTIIVAPPELEMPEPSEPADPTVAPPAFTG